SSNFAILHDGDAERTEKLSELLEWPEARRLLRVCYSGPRYDRNCGCCPKCLGTALAFRSLGREAECFWSPIGDTAIGTLLSSTGNAFRRRTQELALSEAEARGLSGTWLEDLRRAVHRNRGRRALDRFLAARALRRVRSEVP
ncbi:MAG: hypothetical protein ABR564_07165, partial [Candidatus Dormibacteria bacterium]